MGSELQFISVGNHHNRRQKKTLTFTCTVPKAELSEYVRCVFKGSSQTPYKCSSSKAGCEGAGACSAQVKGAQGQVLTWTADCPGSSPASAQTTIDGKGETVEFSCAQPAIAEMITCKFKNPKGPVSCGSIQLGKSCVSNSRGTLSSSKQDQLSFISSIVSSLAFTFSSRGTQGNEDVFTACSVTVEGQEGQKVLWSSATCAGSYMTYIDGKDKTIEFACGDSVGVCGDKVCSGPKDCESDCIICGNNICESDELKTCSKDCCGFCGDGKCAVSKGCNESMASCFKDCGSACGDAKCDASIGETNITCPKDCMPKAIEPVCGDGVCTGYEKADYCLQDCTKCGDGFCTGLESTGSCPSDCKDCSKSDVSCECKSNSDCAKFEDNDLCNGQLYCDKSDQENFKCALIPASVVTCPTQGLPICKKSACEPLTGKCLLGPLAEGTVCDDKDPATSGDYCSAGQCISGNFTGKCKQDLDCKDLDDDLCTGTYFCNKQTLSCEINPATVVKCPTADETACLKSSCDAKTGACGYAAVKDFTACDDDESCTSGDVCLAGKCTGINYTCECTTDSNCIDPDFDLCTGTYFCNKQTSKCELNKGSVVTCDNSSDSRCQENRCSPLTGKCTFQPVNKFAWCDDGSDYTEADFCQDGMCMSGKDISQCKQDSDCKDDGNLCNGVPYCDKTGPVPECKVNPATIVTCSNSSDTECSVNLCLPSTGKCKAYSINEGMACGLPGQCYEFTCQQGQCNSTGKWLCDCTTDEECVKFDDGNLCNGIVKCTPVPGKPNKICAFDSTSVVQCKAPDMPTAVAQCTKYECNPAKGVCDFYPLNPGGSCNDKNPCTDKDMCKLTDGNLYECQGTSVCACKTEEDCAKFDDKNPCNGKLYCSDLGVCQLSEYLSEEQKALCAANASVVKETVACNLKLGGGWENDFEVYCGAENKSAEDGIICGKPVNGVRTCKLELKGTAGSVLKVNASCGGAGKEVTLGGVADVIEFDCGATPKQSITE